MARSQQVLMFVATVHLFGCTGGPEVVTEDIGPLVSLTSQADARHTIVKADRRLGRHYGRFVSEPSPDAFANFTSSLNLLAKGQAERDGAGGELSILNEITKQAVRLGVRSQGIMYLRDAGYRLSEAFMNGAFFPASYERKPPAIRGVAIESIQGGLVIEVLDQETLDAQKESKAFIEALEKILENSRELILYELKKNPTLSGIPEKPEAPRLKAVELEDLKVLVTYEDPKAVKKEVHFMFTLLKGDDTRIGEDETVTRTTDDNGWAHVIHEVHTDAKTMVIRVRGGPVIQLLVNR